MSRVIRLNDSQEKSLEVALKIAVTHEAERAKEPKELHIRYLDDLITIKNKIIRKGVKWK
jgi:hypothetical protein